ncbi:zinc-dependent peptidase [Balneolales bacterium ANBcel1]|nr:zinc-dependent peptidase [Balneolales bacterium ANBcel1]
MGWLQSIRRKKLDKEPFPVSWEKILQEQIPFYRLMTADQRNRYRQLIRYFIAEKIFEGCGGMELGDFERVVISAMACVPLLGGVSDLYPYLRSVLVYPDTYHAHYSEEGVDGVVTEGVESRSGESWDQGVIVFSWKEVEYDLRHPRDGANIVYHECAHQLDYEWGATMEDFSWQRKSREKQGMASVLKSEYRHLVGLLERGRPIAVDDYAATNIHEFFAVMTEAWFERPGLIRRYYPEADRVLTGFYNLGFDFRMPKV